MKEETKDWVALAETDLQAAQVLLAAGLVSPAVFHCQQAVEKLLKAIWVENRGETPPRTHNLVDLADELSLSTPEWLPFLRDLTNQAVATRYAGGQDYPRELAEEHYQRTAQICAQLRHNLN